MPALPLFDARAAVIRTLQALPPARRTEAIPLDEALGRVLAREVSADRDQPPFDRVTRDGFAVRAADVAAASPDEPCRLTVVGEALPGTVFARSVGAGQCVEIMTGAALPAGADAVVMVEHTQRPEEGAVLIQRRVASGDNVVPRGSELSAGAVAFPAGRRLDPAAIGLLASLGCDRPTAFARPRVAVVATGDELVEIHESPAPTQIRNSNRHALAAQIVRAGGMPVVAAIARDRPEALRSAIEAALAQADLLLLSGGVSMGKYDFVEEVLAGLGAKVAFDGVLIRPGRPLVFGTVAEKPFFGLPGNPLSTLVTFELLVRPALDLMSGAGAAPLRYWHARLASDYEQRPIPLVALVPARLESEGPDTSVRALPSQGSGDLASMAAAEVLLVVAPDTARIAAGTSVPVLTK